jgi:hypothetical protein
MGKTAVLHRHHIIPRRDPRCTNSDENISILCPTCHAFVHCGDIIIVGVYVTTGGVQSIWFRKGEEPPLKKEHWRVVDNPLITTIGGGSDDLSDQECEKDVR